MVCGYIIGTWDRIVTFKPVMKAAARYAFRAPEVSFDFSYQLHSLNKKFFEFQHNEIDGCSPLGCVLTRLITRWGSLMTAILNIRSVSVIPALGNYYLHIPAKSTIPLHFPRFH